MISWKSNKPKILQTKVVKKFAWFPVLIDGVHYWLGHYYVKYRYQDGGYWPTLYGAFEGQTHHGGKPFSKFDHPVCWGDYAMGWQGWEVMQVALNKEDITFEEVDNFYNT